MDIRKLQRAIVDGLEDVKGQHIVVFNTEHLSPLFERVIIASGTSNRQTKALASSVRDAVKSKGFDVMRTEGEDNGEWIIVDCGAAVVHVMQPAIREYYHLEEIWGGKPVKMKLDGGTVALPKASEGDDDEASAPAKKGARKTAAKPSKTADSEAGAAATKRAPAKKAGAKTAATRSPAAKKASASRSAGGTAAAPRTAARKAAERRSSAAKTAAATNAPARKPAAKKTAARPAAKKAPAKKTSRA